MKNVHAIAFGAVVTLLVGCAPTSETESSRGVDSTPPSSTQPLSTQGLVADSDFDFRSDRNISLSVSEFPSEVGKLVVYGQYEYFDNETGVYYPDYATRIASFIAATDLSYDLIIPSSQQFLVLEWLPMDGNSNEAYRLFALNSETDYELTF